MPKKEKKMEETVAKAVVEAVEEDGEVREIVAENYLQFNTQTICLTQCKQQQQ